LWTQKCNGILQDDIFQYLTQICISKLESKKEYKKILELVYLLPPEAYVAIRTVNEPTFLKYMEEEEFKDCFSIMWVDIDNEGRYILSTVPGCDLNIFNKLLIRI